MKRAPRTTHAERKADALRKLARARRAFMQRRQQLEDGAEVEVIDLTLDLLDMIERQLIDGLWG